MLTLNQKGIAHIFLIFILLLGLGAGVYLTQKPTNLKPKASVIWPHTIKVTTLVISPDGQQEAPANEVKVSIKSPSGQILASGITGFNSESRYSNLYKLVNGPEVKVPVEQPFEIYLDGITAYGKQYCGIRIPIQKLRQGVFLYNILAKFGNGLIKPNSLCPNGYFTNNYYYNF